MQNAPAAPAPQGLAAALQLLGNPNVFKDITGLEGNQRNAIEALKSSLEAAQQFGSEAADVAKTFGEYATNLSMQSATSQDMDRIQRSVQTARSQGLIDDEQANDLTHSALRAMVGQGVPGNADPRSTETMLNTIRSAREQGSINEDQERNLSEQAIGRMVNNGEVVEENAITPDLAERVIEESPTDSNLDVQDGSRRIIRSGGGGPQTEEREWYTQHPESRSTVSGDWLLLWNYPVAGTSLSTVHSNNIRSYLNSHSLAFLDRGTTINIRGHSSSSGDEQPNIELSRQRALAVRQFIINAFPRYQNRVLVDWVGEDNLVDSTGTPEGMARNRSVEILVQIASPPEIVDRSRHWSTAQQILEHALGATLNDPDQMWTPTITGILRIMPKPIGDPSPNHGNAVPTRPICTDRPADTCMPDQRQTTLNLGRELERQYRIDSVLNESNIRLVVARFIAATRSAIERRNTRIQEIQFASSQGGGSMYEEELNRYMDAERRWFESDPTCLWRYVIAADSRH
jgi:hypothetical protein